MMNFNFIASNRFDLNAFYYVEKFVDSFPDFQTVTLNDESELQSLLQLMGIDEFNSIELSEGNFSKYWDLSNFKLPEFDEDEFDLFYQKWLLLSARDNNMDEYGNLIFLKGLSQNWNRLSFRLIVLERE